jgi:hypothetical protein
MPIFMQLPAPLINFSSIFNKSIGVLHGRRTHFILIRTVRRFIYLFLLRILIIDVLSRVVLLFGRMAFRSSLFYDGIIKRFYDRFELIKMSDGLRRCTQ